MSGRRVLSIIVLIAIVGICAGVSLGLGLAPPPVPGVVSVETVVARVGVEVREYDDARQVPSRPVLSPKRLYSSQAQGVVRRVDCKPGEPIISGSIPFIVNDRAVVALRLALPPWRDLSVGMRGPDVKDFQKELRRLGYDVMTDGFFSWAMRVSVKAFWESVGVKDFAELPLDRLIWLRSKRVVPFNCPVAVGDRLAPGDVVFSTGGRLKSLILELPANVQEGDRLVSAGQNGPDALVGQNGAVNDSDFLEAFTLRRDYKEWLTDPAATVMVTARLKEPIKVVPVPAAALYEVSGSQGCVDDAGLPIRVRIVASQLGQTLVVGDPMPNSVAVPAPKEALACE